jgi:hypothetical protein
VDTKEKMDASNYFSIRTRGIYFGTVAQLLFRVERRGGQFVLAVYPVADSSTEVGTPTSTTLDTTVGTKSETPKPPKRMPALTETIDSGRRGRSGVGERSHVASAQEYYLIRDGDHIEIHFEAPHAGKHAEDRTSLLFDTLIEIDVEETGGPSFKRANPAQPKTGECHILAINSGGQLQQYFPGKKRYLSIEAVPADGEKSYVGHRYAVVGSVGYLPGEALEDIQTFAISFTVGLRRPPVCFLGNC